MNHRKTIFQISSDDTVKNFIHTFIILFNRFDDYKAIFHISQVKKHF